MSCNVKRSHAFLRVVALSVIILLDKLPGVYRASWVQEGEPSTPIKPPEDAIKNVDDLYEGLVPRFAPDMESHSIGQIDGQVFTATYMCLCPTMICLRTSLTSPNTLSQVPGELFPFLCRFNIIESDRLGLLQVLDSALKDIVQSTASLGAEFDDLLAKRLLIAKLQSELPALNREVTQHLQNLLRHVPQSLPAHITTQELESSFR